MRWTLWAALNLLYAQLATPPCAALISIDKKPYEKVVLSGGSFTPFIAPEGEPRAVFRIPICQDSIRVQVFYGERLLMDTSLVLSEGLVDSLYFDGGKMQMSVGSGGFGGVIAPVVIVGNRGHLHALELSKISWKAEGLLAQQLSHIPGIYMAGAGPLLQKPLLEGLGGTRISYFQEGVPLASQQWGEEHAPEIDPLSAEKLYVELGARPVLYGTEAVGGAIGTETPLNYEKPLQGRFALVGLTNGRGGSFTTTLGGQYHTYQYRFHATLSRIGTLKTPTYFLTGTASQQAHFSWHLQKNWEKFSLFAHYSQYNASIGLFQGSHLGNLADFQRAMEAPVPPVRSAFTYQILPPYQSTTHELTQLRLRYFFSERLLWQLTYARQFNRRSEWDAVGIYAQAGKPAIDLQLTRHSFLQEMVISFGETYTRLRLGLNFHYERNYVQYAYFIPRYEKYQPAFYALLSRGGWEMGVRIEPLYWVAYRVPERVGRLLTGTYRSRYAAWWPAWGAEIQRQWVLNQGLSDTLTEPHAFTLRLAYLQRPPNAAELYAYGYHQGRAAFEIGQPTFHTENVFHFHLDWLHRGSYLCLSAYYSPTFIYARVDSPIVWIRGASLAYMYEQGPVTLLSMTGRQAYALGKVLTLRLQGGALWASYRRGGLWRPLPLLPAPYWEPSAAATYQRWQAQISLRWVLRQKRYDPEADLAPPPPGYALLSGEVQYQLPTRWVRWTFSISGDNLLNRSYRQYPDLMRYFANQMGTQVRLTVKGEF